MPDLTDTAAPETEARTVPRPRLRGEIIGGALAAILVAAAFVVPRLATPQWRATLYAQAAPLYANWLPHVGWGTVPAIALAVAVVLWGPTLAQRLSWPKLLATAWATALAWTFALVMVDGWQRGFVGRLADGHEYLTEVGGVTDIPAMLRGFSDRILDFQPDSWTTHVSGHPPGALLFFVTLDRIGLGGSTWAAWACMLIGTTGIVAVAVALRALGAEGRARAALPFLALAPAAIWIGVSADAMFAGVTAWAVALLALATRGRSLPLGFAAGVLFGCGMYLNYGLGLMALPALAVLIAGRSIRPMVPAIIGALLVVAAFTLSGFWWFDGYHLVIERYYQGIATERPYAYWCWANLAATVCAIGLAPVAAFGRGLAFRVLRRRDPAALLVVAGICAIIAADISGLSKAETERIWLPFDLWVLVATAFLNRTSVRFWLAVQAIGTLVIIHLLFTIW